MAGYACFPFFCGPRQVSQRSPGTLGMADSFKRLVMARGTYFPERSFFLLCNKEAVMDIVEDSAGTLCIWPPCTGAVQRLAIGLGLYLMYLSIDHHCLGGGGAGS